MNHLTLSPTLVRWALDRSGLTAEGLRSKLKDIDAWVAGTRGPTLSQLQDFAHRTHTPLGYFFLSEPPVEALPIPDFRTLSDTRPRRPSPELLETVAAMQERQAWMREQLVEDGADELSFVGEARPDAPAETLAATMRAKLGLANGWATEVKTIDDALRHLRRKAEEIGVLVVANGILGNNTHRPLLVDEFRGFALADRHAPLVFVNNKDGKGAQMFTLAHELAHLWLGRDGISNPDASVTEAGDEIERYCNRVAAEFLVPAADLQAMWPSLADEDDPVGLAAKRFKVSPMVVARRARELRLLTHTEFINFITDYRARIAALPPKAASGGGDFWATQALRVGDRFGAAVVRAAKEGRLLYRDAYRLTGIHGETFNAYAAKLGYRI